eukprot:UN01018
MKLPPNKWLTDDAWKIINIKYKLGTNKPYPVTVFNKENWTLKLLKNIVLNKVI